MATPMRGYSNLANSVQPAALIAAVNPTNMVILAQTGITSQLAAT